MLSSLFGIRPKQVWDGHPCIEISFLESAFGYIPVFQQCSVKPGDFISATRLNVIARSQKAATAADVAISCDFSESNCIIQILPSYIKTVDQFDLLSAK